MERQLFILNNFEAFSAITSKVANLVISYINDARLLEETDKHRALKWIELSKQNKIKLTAVVVKLVETMYIENVLDDKSCLHKIEEDYINYLLELCYFDLKNNKFVFKTDKDFVKKDIKQMPYYELNFYSIFITTVFNNAICKIKYPY